MVYSTSPRPSKSNFVNRLGKPNTALSHFGETEDDRSYSQKVDVVLFEPTRLDARISKHLAHVLKWEVEVGGGRNGRPGSDVKNHGMIGRVILAREMI